MHKFGRHKFKKPAVLAVVAVLFAVAVFSVCFTSPAISQQGSFFSDQFDLGSYDWTVIRGDWAVIDSRYTELTKPDTDITWSRAGSSGWVDYSVEAKVYSDDTSAGQIYLAGRWTDENNHYGLEYSDDGSGAAGANTAGLILYKIKNGVRTDLLTMLRSNDPKVPYIGEGASGVADNPYPAVLKVKFDGSNITVYCNGQQTGFTADTSLYYGYIALGEYNKTVYFDDVYVWDVTPPTLYPPSVTEVKGTAASISFSTDELTSYKVEYGTTDSYGSSVTKTTRGTTHSVDLTGLSLSTVYHYRVTVTDAAGNQTVSDDQTFSTLDELDTVAPTVYDVFAGDISATGATINWKSDEPANSLVEWGTEPGVYKWSLSYDARTTVHEVFLKGLEGLTTYYYRVKSRDLSGNIGSSGEYSFTTLKDLQPKVAAIKTGSDPAPATTVNFSVYWLDVPTAVSYKVYVSVSNDWGSPVTVNDTAGKDEYVYSKDSLTPYTNYFVRIYAEDAGGETGYSTVRVFPPSLNPHGNPHGFYKKNAILCGECHYTHSALGPRLISEVNADRMCVTCHDGTQSKYDVLRGKVLGPTSSMTKDENGVWTDVYRATWYDSIAGPYGTVEGFKVEQSVYIPTSRHDLNIYNYAAPGNNIENVKTADSRLSCASCHDPHGSDNYRNLRSNMKVWNDANPPLISMEAYAVTDQANKKEQTVYVSGAVEFCGACHSDFNQGAGASRNAITTTEQPGLTLSKSSTHMYMHPVNIDAQYVTKTAYAVPTPDYLLYENGKIICQTCHFTHGTTNTGTHVRRDGFNSTCLKRFDKTTGCEDCHDKTNHPD